MNLKNIFNEIIEEIIEYDLVHLKQYIQMAQIDMEATDRILSEYIKHKLHYKYTIIVEKLNNCMTEVLQNYPDKNNILKEKLSKAVCQIKMCIDTSNFACLYFSEMIYIPFAIIDLKDLQNYLEYITS